MVFASFLPAHATIRYDVSVARPARHQFHVTMTIPGVQDAVNVQMPAWDSLYQMRDFAYRVSDFHATDASGNPLPVRRIDQNTWRVERNGSEGDVRVDYFTLWDDPGPFDTQLNDEHAFINLAMILCYVPERRGEESIVRFADLPQSWRVAVELPQEKPLPQEKSLPQEKALPQDKAQSAAAPGSAYAAPNYDALVDAPVEIGLLDEWTFPGGGQAAGKPIRVVYHGDAIDHAALTRMLSAIVSYETTMMGDAPFPEYTFILHLGRNAGGGGMEHSNSTAIGVQTFAELADVSAHEFFHLWNVKRIRPQSLEPLDHVHEMQSRALWFAEGVTSTYAAYTLVRTGIWSQREFWADLGEQISELESRPARVWQSAEESSLDTWFDKYAIYNRPDYSISYYNKGQLLGVALDILIRDATDNRASLDDVMRRMNREYAARGRFYDDSAGVEAAIEEVVRAAKPDGKPDAQLNLPDFFRRYVSGTEEMPFADLLARAGLALRMIGEKRSATGLEALQNFSVEESPNPTDRQRRIRAGLLTGATDPPTPR